MSKDKIEVNINVHDIPIVIEELEKAEDEIKQLQQENQQLKKQKDDVVEYVKEHKHLNWYVESCYTDNLLRMLGEIKDKMNELEKSDTIE